MKWLWRFLSIFCNSAGNPDMARVLTFKSFAVVSASVIYAVFKLHQVPNWTELMGGYGLLMTGGGAFIGGKEMALAKANATTAAAPNVAP